MRIRRMTISVAFAVGLATLPLSAANAQYHPPWSPFPLFWPFCVAGAVVGTASIIVTAPLRALTGGTALRVLPAAALLPAAATTGILRSCAAAELLRATLSPTVSRCRHSGHSRLVRDLRSLRDA
jgi:hypothetical protein